MANPNDIAIVGMALRVPGATTPEKFWQNLRNGQEALQQYSAEVLRARGVSPSLLADPDYVPAGMPLADFDEFDPEFFGFSPREAAILDPQHRQFYEVAWEALERAGCVPGDFAGAIGVFAGCGMGSYFAHNILRNADLLRSVGMFLLRHTGNDKDFLATRVSYAFDLKGPSVNVQTACSTSLVATHLAVQSLLARETDVALAGGVTIEIPHGVGYLFQEGEILSPDGHCRPFDHKSKGTVFGSGAAVVVLRRLEDALRDGNHIHAVIKGSAVNNDGASKVGYLAPSVEGQAAAISEAIAIAGIDSGAIEYVECHGTGTPIGDPIEVAALTQAFRESSDRIGHCLLGSVKSNIGHLDTAAGTAGLIKAVLALEHGEIPPSINFEANNPSIEFSGGPFAVASRLTSWARRKEPRFAAVNSLGVGGTNAFVLLEEAPLPVIASVATKHAELIMISAQSRKALDDYAAKLSAWMRENPDVGLGQIAATLGLGRQMFEHRRVFAAHTLVEAADLLERSDAQRIHSHSGDLEGPSVVFMFPGGGAQYVGMARTLHESDAPFRNAMDRGLELLKSKFGVDLRNVFLGTGMDPAAVNEALSRPSVQLPLLFLIEQSLVAQWEHYGVRPAALIGHSMGENAAACVAGVFSLEDALGLVLLRGQLMDEVPDGGMLSVPMAASELRELLGPDLDLAAANGPLLSIASGPKQALADLAARLSTRGVESRPVRIDIAAHSRMLDGVLDRFRAYLKGISLHPPKIPVVSNLTGQWLTDAQATDPDYWVQHLRNTVRFSDGVELLLEGNDRIFLEVGPGRILGSFVRQSHGAPIQRVVSSIRHPDDPVPDDIHFRTVLGRLVAMGVAVPRGLMWAREMPFVSLPTYAFQHSRFWIDPSAPDTVNDDDQALVPERTPAIKDGLYGPRWVQHGILQTTATPVTWCVFHDQDPLLLQCVGELRIQGHRVVEVVAGDTFSRTNEHCFTLAPESGGSAYQELVDALSAADLLPDRILHAWLLTRRETHRPGKTFLHRNQECGFYSLFYLAKAFAKRAEGKNSHWIVLGNGAVSIRGEPVPYPDKATVLGACAVIPRELPGVTCAYVDVALPGGVDDLRAAYGIMEETQAPPGNSVLAWRDRVRWMRYIAPHRVKASGKSIAIRTAGVYLITGGFGGIGGVLADWLAREYQARLVLMSRTPLPPREEWTQWLVEHEESDPISKAVRRVRDLEGTGGQVLPLAADVTVAEQVQDALAVVDSHFGPVHGVFHAAGVLNDGLIALKTERDIEEIFAAKLYGTLVLDQSFQGRTPDFMLLFSSISAFVAPVGQIDYVAANSFLNAFAESCRERRPYPVVAIDWGIWKGVGMVAASTTSQSDTDRARIEISRSREAGVAYPLFQTHHVLGDGTSQVHWLSGQISTQRDWLAGEHRLLRGDALVPATGYVELLRAALAEMGGDPGRVSLVQLSFLRPFYVDDKSASGFRIRLRGNGSHWRAEVFSVMAPERETCELVATARIVPTPNDVITADLSAIRLRCGQRIEAATGRASIRTRQEAHLRFGPRWHVLRCLQFGDGEALAELRLGAALAADLDTFKLHSGLLDVATGCAMDLIPGYLEQETPQNLWVPLGYASFTMRGPMPPNFYSWVRVAADSSVASGFAAFDVSLVNADGVVFAEVQGLQLRRIDGELPRNRMPAAVQSSGGGEARQRSIGPAEKAMAHNMERGISEPEGIDLLQRILVSVDRPVVIASSFQPADLLRQADALTRMGRRTESVRFARPELETTYEGPRDEVERALTELWGKLLGVERIGIRDSFFDLGGHSLIAVRLFNEILDQYGVELPLSVLMQHPDIASLAERIRGGPAGTVHTESLGADGRESFRHLVPMHSGPIGAGTPLFVVAGMFGNVLNLSHVAHLLGEDRPFFALQARGLLDDQLPHDTFEEMARDYLVEVRTVQPEGPYLLGGFSGGGLIAFEMARQLREAGQQVSAMILLDTPIRNANRFGLLDKLEMLLPGFREEGFSYLGRKIRERREWKRELRDRAEARAAEALKSARFHSQRVGDAFLSALAAYKVSPVDIGAALFRPRLRVKFRMRDGRILDAERNLLSPDNGWTPFVRDLSVIEVPGNHDSMVLEPNVRVLVASLRRILERAEL